MDSLNTHSENINQPQGQQANGLPFAVPSQVLDSDTVGQQHTNPLPFWFSHEQHKLQLDQALQLHNEQVQVSLQQEMAIQYATMVNLLESATTDALLQEHNETAILCFELQRKQEYLETALHDGLQWMGLALEAYFINQSLICKLPPVQQETNSHVSSNQLDAPGSRDKASSVLRTTAAATQPYLICKVCNSGYACMLLLPCQHLCACKPCGVGLTVCPICSAVKGGVIEA